MDPQRATDEQATQRRAQILGLGYFDTSNADKPLFAELLTVAELYEMKVIPLSMEKGFIHFGILTTTSQQTMKALRDRFLDYRLQFSIISDTGYRDYMKLYDPPKEVVYQDIKLSGEGSQDIVATVSATLEQVKADDMLAYLVEQAHKLGASDIHIENQPGFVRIRFRIDGVLHKVAQISIEKNRILQSAIASAANVSTNDPNPQQGHIAQKVKMATGDSVDINLRVETVSAINGMDIVMRLFNMSQDMYVLDRLGLSAPERKVVDDIIAKPTGLVLAVGPTGSGKTTTLYSILNSLNSEERKIITVEDPVEFQIDGVTQISVTSTSGDEKNFADKLRAVLRLDPDIVMVGEIRDNDTAKTALQASLTGHLVLSTFHASTAAAAMTRLMDIIGENPLFVSAIRLIMAQRLIRRLDESTKQAYQPDEQTLAKIREIVESLPPNAEKPNLDGLQLYKPGSSADNPYGYKGQIALREQFVMTDGMREVLQRGGMKLSAQDIEEEAVKNGMTTMLQDGILKVIKGETTLEEVYRVIG